MSSGVFSVQLISFGLMAFFLTALAGTIVKLVNLEKLNEKRIIIVSSLLIPIGAILITINPFRLSFLLFFVLPVFLCSFLAICYLYTVNKAFDFLGKDRSSQAEKIYNYIAVIFLFLGLLFCIHHAFFYL